MRHRIAALSVACVLTLVPIRAADDPATAVIQRLDARGDAYAKVALQIWNWAELGFQDDPLSEQLPPVIDPWEAEADQIDPAEASHFDIDALRARAKDNPA